MRCAFDTTGKIKPLYSVSWLLVRLLGKDFKGARIGWLGDLGGHLAMDSDVADTCLQALRHFQTIGCSVEHITPDFDFNRLWQ